MEKPNEKPVSIETNKMQLIYAHLQTANYIKLIGLLLVVAATYRWFYLIDKYSVNILFYDEWDFYVAHFQDFSLLKTFTLQFGPHRQGLGFLLTRLLDHFSGWNIRVITFAIGVLTFLASIVYVFVKKKLFKNISPIDLVVIVFIVLTPTQHGIFTNTPNISHGAMPSLLIATYTAAWLIKSTHLRYVCILLLNINMIFTGFAIFMGLITPALFVLEGIHQFRKGDRKRAMTIFCYFIIACFSLFLFTIDYRFASANPTFQFPHPRPWEYLIYMATALGHLMSFKDIATAQVFGSVYLLVLSIAFFRSAYFLLMRKVEGDEINIYRTIVLLIGFSLLFLLNTAIGRVSMGYGSAQASRYIPYMVPSFIGLYFFICSLKIRYRLPLLVATLVLALFVTTHIGDEIAIMERFKTIKTTWKATYLETENIEQANRRANFKIYPNPERTKLKQKLNYLKKHQLNLYLDTQ